MAPRGVGVRARGTTPGVMGGTPFDYPSGEEFVLRAVTFGVLVVASIASIVLAGSWWAACIAAGGLMLAVVGLLVSLLALLSDEQAASWRASRPTALVLSLLSLAMVLGGLIAG